MFTPAVEATGSATVALATYLAARDGLRDGTRAWVLEQGIEMGRPSCLETEVEMECGVPGAVRVGGASVLVSRGTMRVPDTGLDR